MKREAQIKVLVLVVSGFGPMFRSAHADDTPSLNSLVTPDSPAFVVLGVAPTSIQRPTTPKALATSLLSAFSSNGQTLVPNYALEVAPYWLESHPETTWQDVAKNSFSTPLQTLTVSMATSSSGSPTSLSTTAPSVTSSTVSAGAPKAALGLRTTLHQGTVDAVALKKCTDQLVSQATSVGTSFAQKVKEWHLARTAQITDNWNQGWAAGWQASHPAPATAPLPSSPPPTLFPLSLNLPPDSNVPSQNLAAVQEVFASAWTIAWNQGFDKGWTDGGGIAAQKPKTPAAPQAPVLPSDTIETMTQAAGAAAPAVSGQGCTKAASSRQGFVLDAALAAAMAFPSGEVDNGKLATYALWTTASYLSNNFSGLALARFMQDNLDIAGQHTVSLDIGGRAIVAFSRFGLSAEGVYRIPLDSNTSKNQYRVDVAADLEFVEGYWFSLSGGHDFIDGSGWSKFFALANFKGTFGSTPTVVANPSTASAVQ